MGFIENSLMNNEKIIYKVKITKWIWVIWLIITLFFSIGLIPSEQSTTGDTTIDSMTMMWGIIFFLIPFYFFLKNFIYCLTTELAITNKKIIGKIGFIERNIIEIPLEKVESLAIDQSIIGRLLNYGTIIIRGTGTGEVKINFVTNPLKFRKQFLELTNNKKDKDVLKLRFSNFLYDRNEYQILFDRLEIAGINYKFKNAKKIFTDEGAYIIFKREPNNEYDKNAIAVYGVNNEIKEHIGYVDRKTAKFIVENDLYNFIAPCLKFIMIGYKKVLVTDYQILIKKDKMKELRAENILEKVKS